MPKVELIYDNNCPHVEKTRKQLRMAFNKLGMTPEWKEWENNDPQSPYQNKTYGSPTILVNGRDVCATSSDVESECCRVYQDETGQLQGIPPLNTIVSSLKTTIKKDKGNWSRAAAVLPVVGTALLPKLSCPACWPAYTALLATMGFEFSNYTPYLLPLTILFVILTLILIGYRASNRRGYNPLILASIASVVLIVGKFVFDLDWIMYSGLAVLIGASVWSSWPMKRKQNLNCPSCPPSSEVVK